MPSPAQLTLENRIGRFNRNLILLGICLFVFAVDAVSPVTTSTDSAWTLHLASSILREGNVNLDEYRSLMNLQLDYRLRVVDGHIYSYYPIATPLLVTPVVWIVNKIYPLFYPTDFYTYLALHAPDSRTAKIEKLIASGIIALSAALMYLVARRYLSTVKSLAVTFIFAFATSVWSTASRALWQHGPSVLFLALALLLVLQVRERPAFVPWLGIILGFSYLIRPTNSLTMAFLGLYILVNFPRRVWQYIAGAAVVLIPYMIENWLTYGNIFPPYSYQLFQRLATPQVFGEGLVGTLISPARGLFVFSTVFLFSIVGVYLIARKRQISISTIDLYLIGVIVAHWIVTSLFEDWGGAWSIGPRYFVDIIPFLTYFLIPVFQGDFLAKPAWSYALLTTVLVSTLIQLHCSTSIYPFMWNGKPEALVEAPQRKWDWGDLQFLRGFCPNDPLEGRAPACWFGSS